MHSARRIFWDKVTELHADYHRPAACPTPHYFSRHYCGIAMLLDTEDGEAASTDFKLLDQVAKPHCQGNSEHWPWLGDGEVIRGFRAPASSANVRR